MSYAAIILEPGQLLKQIRWKHQESARLVTICQPKHLSALAIPWRRGAVACRQ